jgi:alcohol dehydrogenase class IV
MMIQSFTFECPGNVFFGKKSREQLPGIVQHYGSKVCIFTGTTWFEGSGWKERVKSLLSDFKLEFISCPGGEPTDCGIQGLIETTRTLSPDVIVGIGGGSVLDSAKAVSGLMDADHPVADYLEGIGKGLSLEKAGIPWIALPTTSGTGAEATKNSVITSRDHKVKKSLRSRFLIADAVIVDPEFTLDLPLSVTGLTGMDALVQLLESFLSKKAKPMPRALVKETFPLMVASLKKIAADPSDIEARTDAAYGSFISGLALANSGLGAVHGFASALGGLSEIPHGLVCAVFLNPVLKANADVIRDDLEELLRDFPGFKKESPIQWLMNEVSELLALYGIPSHIKKYGLSRDMAETIAQKATGSSMSGNPKELTLEEKKSIVCEVL